MKEADVMLFVLGAMRWLQDNGYADGDSILLPKGTAFFDQLEASGFRPAKEDVADALQVLIETGRIRMNTEDADVIVTLISNWDTLKSRDVPTETAP
jgi:hypothetical protein